MKEYTNYRFLKFPVLVCLGLLIACLTSCVNDFESVPIEQFTEDFVFSSTDSAGVLARQNLAAIYSTMYNGHNRVGGDYLDAATDDAISSSLNESDVDRIASGRFTATNTISSEMDWGAHYRAIRMCNIFITNIDVVPLKDTFGEGKPLNLAWKSEVRFIRAYHYFELLKRYGGIPIMGDQPSELNDDLQLARDSFSDVVDYLSEELQAIEDKMRTYPIADLSGNAHIVTAEAAMALRTRVLLYAASPLYNGGNIGTGSQMDLVGYSQYDEQRWAAAAEAGRDFIQKYGSRFSLNPDFTDIFITDGNPEIIFFRQGGNNTSIETTNGPVGYSGANLARGRTSPTQNLVDAFPMKDGKSIDDPTSSYTYSASQPYENRDPRLGWTILYNGAPWLNRAVETFSRGADNPTGASQKTKTSYYMRKFMGDFENQAEYSDKRHNWISIRYAEVLMNFAEAQNEAFGPSPEVDQVIFDLRARAGIDQGDDGRYGLAAGLSKEEMRKVIQNERRIEFAFEEHRYWDIRRWKLAEEIFTTETPLQGLVIVKSGSALNFNETDVASYTFQPRRYFYPIPYAEILNNRNMVQNPGW